MSDRTALFTAPVLVVNQKAKFIELTNEYVVSDPDGNRLGAVAEVGQSTMKKVARFVSNIDQFMTHTYEIRDANEQPVLTLTRPRKIFKSSFLLTDAAGAEIGQIKQKNVFGKIKFSLEAGGNEVGMINAENWRAWNFNVQDANGNEVARITKKWAGVLKEGFTTADNYIVEITQRPEEPLLSLVIAASLCVDTALKQDDKN
jgi:uncharacterized protein YxjI